MTLLPHCTDAGITGAIIMPVLVFFKYIFPVVLLFIVFWCAKIHIIQNPLLSTLSSEKQNVPTFSSVFFQGREIMDDTLPRQCSYHSLGQGGLNVMHYLTFSFPTAGLPLTNQTNKNKMGDSTSSNVEFLFLFTYIRVMGFGLDSWFMLISSYFLF